ncbi:MAG: glycine cleavage system protein H [Bacteroidales bacterium]|nr:glycine cleavage system protein H [Bacteroidales bacterium]
MDGFSYTNIFDTKGIEYLIIIGFLILIVPFWRALNKPLMVKEKIRESLGVLNAAVLRIPEGLLFNRNHVWTHLERSGKATLGLDDLLMHITGEVELKNFRNPGERVKKGDLIAEMTQDGKQLKITSPVSGEISDVNDNIISEPALLNDDPYQKGWLYKIKPERWKEETDEYYMAGEAKIWAEKELLRFKDFVANSVKKYSPQTADVVLQEGGELVDYPLSGMPAEAWNDFQDAFLSPGA